MDDHFVLLAFVVAALFAFISSSSLECVRFDHLQFNFLDFFCLFILGSIQTSVDDWLLAQS